jgi:hypothetical protein
MNRVNNDKPCAPHPCFESGKCDIHGCSERVYDNTRYGSFHPHPCNKNAIIVKGNKQYCKIHDPEYVNAKKAERQKAYNDKWDKRERESKIRMQREKIVEELLTYPDNSHLLPQSINNLLNDLRKLMNGG